MMKSYEPFKQAAIEKVMEHFGAEKGQAFEQALTKKWTVEFRIADFPRKDGSFRIPFFSRLTLRDEARKIEAMNFKLKVGFIKLAEAT